MASLPPSRVVYSTLFFLLVMALLVLSRPALMFKPDGSVKRFGVSRPPTASHASHADGGEQQDPADTTVFPLGVATVVVAVLSLYVFALIDVVAA